MSSFGKMPNKPQYQNIVDKRDYHTTTHVNVHPLKEDNATLLANIDKIIRVEFDSIDTSKMTEEFYLKLSSIERDMGKKFEGSKSYQVAKDYISHKFEVINEGFLLYMSQIDKKKNESLEVLLNCFKSLKEQILSLNESKLNSNQINYQFDEEFVALINSLSSYIKEFFKACRYSVGVMKGSSDSIIDNILLTRSTITEVNAKLNSLNIKATTMTSRTGAHQVQPGFIPSTLQDKQIRESLSSVVDKIELINDSRLSIAKNIKLIEQCSKKFYDEAKVVFKDLKNLRSKKISDEEQKLLKLKNEVPERNYNTHSEFYDPSKLNNLRQSYSNRNYDQNTYQDKKANMRSKSNHHFFNEKDEIIDKLKTANNDLLDELAKLKKDFDSLQEKEKQINNSLNPKQQQQRKKTEEISQKLRINNEITSQAQQECTPKYNENYEIRYNTQNTLGDLKETSFTKEKIEKGGIKGGFIKYENINKSANKPDNSQKSVDYYLKNSENSNLQKQMKENEDLVRLANLVQSFLADLKALQESISKKLPNVPELKRDFENKKVELLNFTKIVLGSKKDQTAILGDKTGQTTKPKIEISGSRISRNLADNDSLVQHLSTNKSPMGDKTLDFFSQKNAANIQASQLPKQEDLVNTLGNGQEIINIHIKEPSNESQKLITAFEKLKKEKSLLDKVCEDLTKEKKELTLVCKSCIEKIKKSGIIDGRAVEGQGEMSLNTKVYNDLEDYIDEVIKLNLKFKRNEQLHSQEIQELRTSLNNFKNTKSTNDKELIYLKTENGKLQTKGDELYNILQEKEKDIELLIQQNDKLIEEKKLLTLQNKLFISNDGDFAEFSMEKTKNFNLESQNEEAMRLRHEIKEHDTNNQLFEKRIHEMEEEELKLKEEITSLTTERDNARARIKEVIEENERLKTDTDIIYQKEKNLLKEEVRLLNESNKKQEDLLANLKEELKNEVFKSENLAHSNNKYSNKIDVQAKRIQTMEENNSNAIKENLGLQEENAELLKSINLVKKEKEDISEQNKKNIEFIFKLREDLDSKENELKKLSSQVEELKKLKNDTEDEVKLAKVCKSFLDNIFYKSIEEVRNDEKLEVMKSRDHNPPIMPTPLNYSTRKEKKLIRKYENELDTLRDSKDEEITKLLAQIEELRLKTNSNLSEKEIELNKIISSLEGEVAVLHSEIEELKRGEKDPNQKALTSILSKGNQTRRSKVSFDTNENPEEKVSGPIRLLSTNLDDRVELLEKIKALEVKLNTEKSNNKELVKQIQGHTTEISNLENQINELNKEFEAKENELVRETQNTEKAETKYEELKNKYEKLKEKAENTKNLKLEISKKEMAIVQLNLDNEKLEKAISETKKLESLKLAENSKSAEEIEGLKEKIEKLEESLKSLNLKRLEEFKICEAMNNALRQKENQLNDIRATVKQKYDDFDKLTQTINSENSKEKERLREEISSLRSDNLALNEEIAAMKYERDKEVFDKETLENKMNSQEKRVDELRIEIDDLQKEILKLTEINKKLTEAHQIDQQELKNLRATITSRENVINGQLSKISDLQQESNSKDKEIEVMTKDANALRQKNSLQEKWINQEKKKADELANDIQVKETEIEDLRLENEQLQKKVKQIEETNKGSQKELLKLVKISEDSKSEKESHMAKLKELKEENLKLIEEKKILEDKQLKLSEEKEGLNVSQVKIKSDFDEKVSRLEEENQILNSDKNKLAKELETQIANRKLELNKFESILKERDGQIQEIKDNVKARFDELSSNATKIKKESEKEKETLLKSINNLKEENINLNNQISLLKNELSILNFDKETFENRIITLNTKLIDQKSKIKELDEKVASLAVENEKLLNSDQVNKDVIKEKNSEIFDLKFRLEDKASLIDSKEGELRSLANNHNAKTRETEVLKLEITSLKETVNTLQKEIGQVKVSEADLHETLRKKDIMIKDQGILQQEIEKENLELKATIADLRAEIDQLNIDYSNTMILKKNQDEKVKNLSEELKQLNETNFNLVKMQESNKQKNEDLVLKITNLKNELKNLQDNDMSSKSDLESKLVELKQKLFETENEYSKVSTSFKECKSLNTALEEKLSIMIDAMRGIGTQINNFSESIFQGKLDEELVMTLSQLNRKIEQLKADTISQETIKGSVIYQFEAIFGICSKAVEGLNSSINSFSESISKTNNQVSTALITFTNKANTQLNLNIKNYQLQSPKKGGESSSLALKRGDSKNSSLEFKESKVVKTLSDLSERVELQFAKILDEVITSYNELVEKNKIQEDDLVNVTQNLHTLNKQLTSLKETLSKTLSEKEKLIQEKTDLEKVHKEHLSGTESNIQKITRESNKNLNEKLNLSKENIELLAKITTLESQLKDSNKELSDLSDGIVMKNQEIDELKAQQKTLLDQLTTKDNQTATLIKNTQEQSSSIKQLEAKVSELNDKITDLERTQMTLENEIILRSNEIKRIDALSIEDKHKNEELVNENEALKKKMHDAYLDSESKLVQIKNEQNTLNLERNMLKKKFSELFSKLNVVYNEESEEKIAIPEKLQEIFDLLSIKVERTIKALIDTKIATEKDLAENKDECNSLKVTLGKYLNNILKGECNIIEELELHKVMKEEDYAKIDQYLGSKTYDDIYELVRRATNTLKEKSQKVDQLSIQIQELVKQADQVLTKTRSNKSLPSISVENFSDFSKLISNKSNYKFFNPEQFKILKQKFFCTFKWVLLAEKSLHIDNYSFSNLVWVPSEFIDVGKYEKDFNQESADKDVEIQNLRSIQEELINKISQKTLEADQLKDKVIRLNSLGKTNISGNSSNVHQRKPSHSSDRLPNPFESVETIPLEKFQKLLNNFVEEQEKLRKSQVALEMLKKENDAYKKEVDILRKEMETRSMKFDKESGDIVIDQPANNSKFLDEDDDIKDFFQNAINLEIKDPGMYRRNSAAVIKTGSEVFGLHSKPDYGGIPTARSYKEKQQFEMAGGNDSKKTGDKDSVVISTKKEQESFREQINKMEENEKLFAEQLSGLKDELKTTRKERDSYRKRYEESITLQDGKKQEIIIMLKQAFDKLVSEITMTSKIKEYIKIILRILDYKDSEISALLENNKKKEKGFLGMFGGNQGKK